MNEMSLESSIKQNFVMGFAKFGLKLTCAAKATPSMAPNTAGPLLRHVSIESTAPLGSHRVFKTSLYIRYAPSGKSQTTKYLVSYREKRWKEKKEERRGSTAYTK